MTGLRFERLTNAAIPKILEIEAEVHSAPWSQKSFENELDHPHGIFIVVMFEGDVVGYGGAWILVDESHITTIAVRPQSQRKGIGRKIMVELLRLSVERGATCSTLEVRVSNQSAIALYESLGYVQVGIRKNYYPDNKEDAAIMWLYELAS